MLTKTKFSLFVLLGCCNALLGSSTGLINNFCNTTLSSLSVQGTAFLNNVMVNGSLTGTNLIMSCQGCSTASSIGATGKTGATGANGATGAIGPVGPAANSAVTNTIPRFKLLIYYGYPSLITINNSSTAIGTLQGAAQAFAEYDVIVLGGGIESPTHPDHANTFAIITAVHAMRPTTLIFGYIDLGVTTSNYTIAQMQVDAQQWQAMGVNGIFWDDAGYDYDTIRSRQTTMILYARSLGLASFMNAWNPDDVFSSTVDSAHNPTGAASVMGANDWFLLESFPYSAVPSSSINAGWVPRATLISRIQDAQNWRNSFGSKIAAASIVDYSTLTYIQQQYFRSMTQAIGFVSSFDAYGDSAYGYSASGANANKIFKGWWDMEMGRYANQDGHQPLLQDTTTTFNRHDYETIVTYVDGSQWSFTTALTNAFVNGTSIISLLALSNKNLASDPVYH